MRIAIFLQEGETRVTEGETRGLGPCGSHLEGVRSAHTSGPQGEEVSAGLYVPAHHPAQGKLRMEAADRAGKRHLFPEIF